MTEESKNERRIENGMRGIRQGIMQEAFDNFTDTFTKPILEVIQPALQKIHPSIDFFNPVIKEGLEMATTNVLAELVVTTGIMADKLPLLDLSKEDALEVTDGIARALRGHSGAKLGDKAGEFSIMLLPMVKSLLVNAKMAGIFNMPSKIKELEDKKDA